MDSTELQNLLDLERAKNSVLHRRVQHVEAACPAFKAKGRARLASDCVRLNDRLTRIREIAVSALTGGHRCIALEEIMELAKDV